MTHLSKARVVRVLEKAIEKLQKVGWVKNQSRLNHAITGQALGYCMTGAINFSTKSERAGIAARQAIGKVLGHMNLTGYNDNPFRTLPEVISVLRRAKRAVAR